MAEEIEMDNLDPDTKVDDNDDDDVIVTSSSHIFNEDDLSKYYQRKHADEGFETIIEKLSDKLPTHLKAKHRNIYFADAAVEILGEKYLLDIYPDAGDLRYKPVEMGIVKTGPAKGRIGVRLFRETNDFSPIFNKEDK